MRIDLASDSVSAAAVGSGRTAHPSVETEDSFSVAALISWLAELNLKT